MNTMETTTIGLAIACVLLVLSFYVIFRLDGKLSESKSKVKGLELSMNDLQSIIDWKDQILSNERTTAQKINHKYQALRVDYDLLQCDNRELVKELEKFRNAKKPKGKGR